jgi:hypothetical protein
VFNISASNNSSHLIYYSTLQLRPVSHIGNISQQVDLNIDKMLMPDFDCPYQTQVIQIRGTGNEIFRNLYPIAFTIDMQLEFN